MEKIFLTLLNMSLTGTFVIAVICVARLPLKKAPKIISYCLWAVAGFRLAFPFSIESVFSLIPFKARSIPPDIAMQPIPRIDSGIPVINNAVSSILPAPAPIDSVNPLQIWTAIGAWIWIIGVAIMFIYGVVSFFILKRKMSEAAHSETNIFEAKNINSPFVLGVFKPRIYLPIGLSGQERSYIILHEQTHIRRRDHIVKLAAYFVLCLHWFNLLVWTAFLLMGVDMEMSCDERVLKKMGGETKKDYSLSLLSLATERRFVSGSPLAFGEGGIKERVKNVLKFKKTARGIIVAAVALAAVLSVGFALNKADASINSVPKTSPLLAVGLITDDSADQRVNSAQLTNGWTVENKNGTSTSYVADSSGALQLNDGYDDITLNLSGANGEIVLEFSDGYPPLSLSIQRWDAKYAGTDSTDVWDNGEPVAANKNTFRIINDGVDYIYEVYAKWEQGYSWYAFRVDTGDETPEEYVIRKIYSLEETYIPIHMKPFSVVTYNEDAVPTIMEGGKMTAEDLRNHEARDFISDYPYNDTDEIMLVVPYIKAEYDLHGFIQNIYYLNPDYPGETRLDPTNWWPGDTRSNRGEAAPRQRDITPTPANWTRNQSLGADNPQLDYAGQFVGDDGLIGTRVIFHGYFGLFVYDTREQRIVFSLDLKAIGCDSTQGDAYCEVIVNDSGDKIILHPMNVETMYVLQFEETPRLYETPYDENDVTPFKPVSIETAFALTRLPGGFPHGQYSDTAAAFSAKTQTLDGSGEEGYAYYGYLYFEDGTLGGICYVEDDMVFELFQNTETVTRIHPITGESQTR